MINIFKKIYLLLGYCPEGGDGGDEAHETMDRMGYKPSHGHVKEVEGKQFVWVEDDTGRTRKDNELDIGSIRG
jgi:hypothetical protein